MCGRITWLLPIVLLLTACEQGTPILRGEKLPPVKTSQAAQTDDASVPSLLTLPGAEVDELNADEAGGPVTLNLTLPDLNWGDIQVGQQQPLMDNVFQREEKERLLNWSGRLHLDESEEAKARPITDNILGAEVELKLRLP